MNRDEVNWRLATYVAAVLGATVWAVLTALVLTEFADGGRALPAGVWAPSIAASALLLGLGATLTWRGRSVVRRSWGVALVTSALIGWLALASSYWVGTAMLRWG